VRIDSKGRISIPAWVRRNFLLFEGSKVELRFDWKRRIIILVFDGQDSVNCSTKACGVFSPGANPGPGPFKIREDNYDK
jgi:AbrB family looped-hinge helix DNA binding protein